MFKDWNDLPFWKSKTYEDIHKTLKDHSKLTEIYPHADDVLRAFVLTPFSEVKVVILGQDPYHTKGVADGLAFSSNDPKYCPPSLSNILTELINDLGAIWMGEGYSLEPWARQGVLLLNTSLTVRKGRANSHQHIGWDELAQEVITTLSKEKEHIVFILWGKHGKEYQKYINEDKHLVITSSHPSPLSANISFFNSRPFSRTNAFLSSKGIREIDWSL